MEEITQVDHRTTISAYETDRDSIELLAKTYQRIADFHEQFSKFGFSAGGQIMTGIIRVALYARVSSQQQADANTIDSQTQAILERIRCDGFRVDRVYIHTPDRLARKYAHQALLLEEFSKHHCKVIFGDHRGLADNPETNLLVQMQGVIAEYEREKILERTRRGRRHAAVSGNVSVFGRAPYGYQHIKKTTSGGKASWEIDPVRSKHVQLIFKLVGEQGYSLAAVCRELQSRGIKTAKGNIKWNTTSVHDILSNSAYHGQARYGKQRMVPRKQGKRAKRGDPSIPRKAKVTENTLLEEHIVISVPAIVNLSLFEQVRTTMQENQKRQRERLMGAKHLLSGLAICGQCGSAYCGHHHGGQNEYSYYRCIGADKYRRVDQVICDNRAVNGFRLEEYVWKDECKLLQDPKRLRTELERRRNQNGSSESNLKELVRRVSQVRSRIDRLIDAYESGLLEKTEFESRIVTLRSEHDRESFALSSLRGTLNESDDTATAEAVLGQLRTQVGEGLETASEELKRDVINSWFGELKFIAKKSGSSTRCPKTLLTEAPPSGAFYHFVWSVL